VMEITHKMALAFIQFLFRLISLGNFSTLPLEPLPATRLADRRRG
jgi:hypothetical protein